MYRIGILICIAQGSRGLFPKPGETFLRVPGCTYRIDDFLDSGSSSRIYSATCIQQASGFDMPMHVAIKYLCTPRIDYLDHIDQEIRTLGRLNGLNSKNIVRAYYASEMLPGPSATRCRFIVLSRTGKDMDRTVCTSNIFQSPALAGLDMKVQDGFSIEAFAASVGLQLIDIISLIHQTGITHGDLYHYNIALSYPDASQVIVIDFGGALEDDTLTQNEVINRRKADVIRVIEFVKWIVEQRIVNEQGKEALGNLRLHSRFLAYLNGIADSNSLVHMLMRYLEVELKVNWNATNKSILYMRPTDT